MAAHDLIKKFQEAGQGQVFAYFDQLDSAGKKRLLADAAEVDPVEIAALNESLLQSKGAVVDLSGLEPAPYEPLPENGGNAASWQAARAAGELALRAGRVAAFTVAGGQGTRLGYDGPKGTFAVTPLKQKTLFQVFAEKLLAAGQRYGKPLHWFIMTSLQNHEATESFFAEHDYFGLDADHVHLFKQGRMPAVDFDGKILMESRDAIAMSPDGHGGSLRALDRSGALDLMERERIDALSYFQVDNPLVRCIDAEFIGWHFLRESEMSSKMVPKAYSGEKVGHFCRQGEGLVVVEYSDLPAAVQEETDAAGGLRFKAGSIAIHILDREFIRRMARSRSTDESLSFHRADKKVPSLDVNGQSVKSTEANGVKFELFVFDALPFARNPVVIETNRADDFSPVKNAKGVDSAQTCRDDQLRQFARWLRAAGKDVSTDESGLPSIAIEVAPTFGYDEETFIESWKKLSPTPTLADGLYLST